MKTYSELLEAVNSHMTHIDDLIFIEGVAGARKAILFLNDIADMLGHGKSPGNVTVKWDGCLRDDTVILTSDGDKTIKDICNSESPISVYGRDLEKDISYPMKIPVLNKSVSPPGKKWVKVTFENEQSITLTEDHKIHTTNRGWVEAGELRESDDVTEM